MGGIAYAYEREAGERSPAPKSRLIRPGATAEQILQVANERRKWAKQDRKKYEPVWKLVQAFMAGRQWVGITKRSGRVLEEPNPHKRERHTVNVLTQYFWTALGKLYDDNFMPSMQFARPDNEAQWFTEHLHDAFEYAWDVEVGVPDLILDMLLEMVGYGTMATQVKYDILKGRNLGEVPVTPDGRVLTAPDESDPDYRRFLERKQAGEFQMRQMNEGKIEWNPLSPWNLLPPPGIKHERNFPHLIIEQAALLSDVQAVYGEHAEGLVEQDLSQEDLIGDRDLSDDSFAGSGKLRGHVLLSQMFERPCADYPEGRVVTWSGQNLLNETLQLPIVVNGERCAGIRFFRYHRVPGRFWGMGLPEQGIGPQRQRNRARSQHIEMKDKNLGRVYARKGSLTEGKEPVGKIMELIYVKQSAEIPTETSGVAPGNWIEGEARMNDEDLEKVMGFRDVAGSDSAKGITAYAAFALREEQDNRRVGPIMAQFRLGLIDLSRYTTFCMRRYWSTKKQILLAGPDNEPRAFVFNATTVPEEVFFHYGKGAPAPRSQAAEIQKIFDVYDRSVSSGRPLPLSWLMDSLEAGKALPIPNDIAKLQKEKAQLENLLMAQGHPMPVAPDDEHMSHIAEHMLAFQQAQMFGRMEVAQMILAHVDQHKQGASAQQMMATSVPGLQGPMGELGAPQAPPVANPQAAMAGTGAQ